jgi:hypothetical protein
VSDDNSSLEIPEEKLDKMPPRMRDFVSSILDNTAEISNPQTKENITKLTKTLLTTDSLQTREIAGLRIIGNMQELGKLDPKEFTEEIKTYIKINSPEDSLPHPERE